MYVFDSLKDTMENMRVDGWLLDFFSYLSGNFSCRTKYPSCLFFQYNTQLGPPYHVLVDTNFINFSIKAKLDIVQSMMDCLYAKCKHCGQGANNNELYIEVCVCV